MLPWERRAVVISGASGFLGTIIASAASQAGASVRGLVRRSDAPLPGGVEPVLIRDLGDPAILATACEGADLVIHLAARVHRLRASEREDEAAFRRDNVEGTASLLSAGARTGVRTFIFISSVKAIAERSDDPLPESIAPRPEDAYGRSKLAAEQLVTEWGRDDTRRVVVLRLPLVYGPGMGANMLRLFRAVARGIPLPLGSIRNRRSVLSAANLVRALGAVLTGPNGSVVYHVADPDPLSTPELVHQIAGSLGVTPRLVPFPPGLLRRLGGMGKRLVDSLVLDTRAIAHDYPALVLDPTAIGLRETARWFWSTQRS
ncbi:MAG: NAD-dependent epimerase/dehydratase family protein [Gemmatimonadales bacterium]